MKFLKQAIPHIVAVIIFLLLSIFYFQPTLDGYDLRQGDADNWRGMSHEVLDFREEYDEEPLWTNSMFGGMPAYQISVAYNNNWVTKLTRVYKLFLTGGPGILFSALLSFYILGLCMRINPWLSIVGAVGFGFASITILYLGAGHTGKIHALSYMPGVVAGILLTLRRKLFLGGAVTALFLSFHLAANHLQMTYYLLFLVTILGITEGIQLFVAGKGAHLLKAAGILIVSAVIAVLPNYGNLTSTYEYGKYTTRGVSELTAEAQSESDRLSEEGLDRDYILQYSMAKGEVMSLLIPNVKGGKSDYLGNHPEAMATVDRQYRETVSQQSSYWGEQLFTGGAFYFGAIVVFLFVMGAVLGKDSLKWGLLAMTLLAVFLSWKQTDGLQGWFLENFPYYTKFRDTKMILVTAQLCMPLMAILFLQDFLFDKEYREKLRKRFLITSAIFVAIILVLMIKPTSFFDFTSTQEEQALENAFIEAQEQGDSRTVNYIDGLKEEMVDARIAIFKDDAVRSLMFILGAILSLALVAFKVLDKRISLTILGLLVLTDLWAVDRRYLNDNRKGGEYQHYVREDEKLLPFQPSSADELILQQEKNQVENFQKKVSERLQRSKEKIEVSRPMESRLEESVKYSVLNMNSSYRVLNMNNPFADAQTSYFHKSIGGYHGAKLKRYQELIDFHLQPEIESISSNAEQYGIMGALQRMPILNMLNTKYIIANPEAAPIKNPYALGNAWFVDSIQWVPDADSEMEALKNFDPSRTAVIDERFQDKVPSSLPEDTTASIVLKDYKPNKLTYQSSSSNSQLAVFSEIYYPAGWNAYVDGEKQEYLRVNYLLRGMMVPEGNHEIEFRFEPASFRTGMNVALIGSILLILYLLAAIFKEFKDWRNREPEEKIVVEAD